MDGNQVSTETAVSVEEFSEYSVQMEDELQLVFGLVEFKAFLAFCENAAVDEVDIHFNDPGSPLLVRTKVSEQRHFSGQIALSTLFIEAEEAVEPSAPSSQGSLQPLQQASKRSKMQESDGEEEEVKDVGKQPDVIVIDSQNSIDLLD
jgi:hypothetical protein